MALEGIFTFRGQEQGETLTVMAGVHGDEICGVRALDCIIPEFQSGVRKIDRGTVNFIYGNPRAIERGAQFTEMNLNRAFRPKDAISEQERNTYERRRALELMTFLRESSALVDVHSSSTRKSVPFIICEPHSFPIARRFPFPIRSSGWDAIEPGGTDYFVNQCGGCGICAECGYHLDGAAVSRAKDAIRIFLVTMGAISGDLPLENGQQREVRVFHAPIVKVGYVPAREFADFERLKEGELIGKDGDEEFFAPPQSVIIFGNIPRKRGDEAFIIGREA